MVSSSSSSISGQQQQQQTISGSKIKRIVLVSAMNNNVVMLVGCSGVGKSSLGNRMFGLMPSYPSKPFRVDDPTVYPVAGTLQAFTGTHSLYAVVYPALDASNATPSEWLRAS